MAGKSVWWNPHVPAGGASVPRAPGLADLPNVTQADFWLKRAEVQVKDSNFKVLCTHVWLLIMSAILMHEAELEQSGVQT